MTWAVEHPNERRWSHRTATSSQSGTRVWVRPIGAAEVGLLAALVGAWGAISVFVGPDFGYRPTTAGAWAWTTQNWFLHLLPGAVAVAAGLMILSASPSRRHDGNPGANRAGGARDHRIWSLVCHRSGAVGDLRIRPTIRNGYDGLDLIPQPGGFKSRTRDSAGCPRRHGPEGGNGAARSHRGGCPGR